MLWNDLITMDEFFRLEPVNVTFFEVFVTLREEPFAVQTDEVKVFNEVYYQITRMLFEYPMPASLPNYIADIKANMGWNYSAELVMSMAFFLFSLIDKNDRPLNKFFTKAINEKFCDCLYWNPFKHCFEELKKKKRHVNYRFHPRPIESEWLNEHYINWFKITHNYDLLCIEKVINLWSNADEKREVARMINDSILLTQTNKNAADLAHIRHFMEVYFIADEKPAIWYCKEESYWEECERLKNHIEVIEKEKKVLQERITELKADNDRLNTLLEKKKRNGKARKFTLVQIVDYCKGCVAWDDAKEIVKMLNKLLRQVATNEDSELVDSIEEEFKNRIRGNIHVGSVEQMNAILGKNAKITIYGRQIQFRQIKRTL